MDIKCCRFEKITGNNVTLAKEQMKELAVDARKWKSLYQCLICGSFWEERFIDDRFCGIPYLVKITENHVRDVWGHKYLNGNCEQ